MSKYIKLFSFAALMLVAFFGMAQTQGSQSRLNIGKNPNPSKITTQPVSSYIKKGELPSEIFVNSNSVINEFYKDLLLRNTSKVISPKAVYEAESISKDKLYVDNEISISNIYPNPANDIAYLDYRLDSSRKTAKVSFYNILGGQVGDFNLETFENRLSVQTRTWDNGVYFYQLILDGKKVATKKLLVRHN
ncbi:T9SS type A sorting domain-containing protein [Arcticibacterium luteifluviistationis]|nr:T9SS type A sorting domain-containing protein [Arcticibacterium luteifluviistationis]